MPENLKPCGVCGYQPVIWYEPGATVLNCGCKITAYPDIDTHGELQKKWNESLHQKQQIDTEVSEVVHF